MPPEGYTTVTIGDELAAKLTRIMAENECASYAEAIEYAADTTLVQESKITVRELIHLLADRAEELE
jgi:metal-responsive CopG/Arc/MetJ family transcriptional regulator